MSLSVGSRLRSAREFKQLTLDEVARATKIQRRTLEAIEEDRVEEILDPTYTKIFLKKYATYLELDGTAILSEYLGTAAAVRPSAPAPSPAASAPLFSSETFSTPVSSVRKIFFPAILWLIAMIGISLVGYRIFHHKRPKAAKVVVSREVLFEEKPATVEQPARLLPERRPQESKFLVPRSQPLKLSLKTKADVWVQVKSDGMVIFQNVLPKGSKESWTAKDELEIWTGNAGAMELFLNGKPLEGLGSGVKKGIRVTHQGLES